MRLAEVIRLAVRFLDDVIEVNRFPMPQIEQATLANRKIGLGLMGFADLLIELRIPYDSLAAVSMAERVMGFIQTEAKQASLMLARERGSFPTFPQSVLAGAWSHMRNATVTSIAPTGSISLIAGCSQSIEPVFSFIQKRRILTDQKLVLVHPAMAKRSNETTCNFSGGLSLQGDLIGGGESVAHLRRAHDISPEWQVRVLAAFQRHVDNGVSKTVNLPANAKHREVKQCLMAARNFGCKGVTVFRDGSKGQQILGDATPSEDLSAQDNTNYRECFVCG